MPRSVFWRWNTIFCRGACSAEEEPESAARQALLDQGGRDLSILGRAEVPASSRSTVSPRARLVSAEDLALMRRLGELDLDYSFGGARMLRSLLRLVGVYAGRPPHRGGYGAPGIRVMVSPSEEAGTGWGRPDPKDLLPYVLRGFGARGRGGHALLVEHRLRFGSAWIWSISRRSSMCSGVGCWCEREVAALASDLERMCEEASGLERRFGWDWTAKGDVDSDERTRLGR